MIYPKIEECIEKTGGSKYALAVVVGKRAKELTYKMPGEFTGSKGNTKEISYALTEIEAGTISLQAIQSPYGSN